MNKEQFKNLLTIIAFFIGCIICMLADNLF